MIDFSRAEVSKNHHASFMKTSNNIISFVEDLQSKYNSTREKLEIIRKEMAAIKEETIQLIKNNKIRLGKQLCRCDNKELNAELLNAINALEDDEKEKIQINLIKINNRYDKIQVLGKELEEIAEKIAAYRVIEDDYEEEVVLTNPKKDKEKKSNTNEKKKEKEIEKKETLIEKPQVKKVEQKDKELEKVVNIHSAKEALLKDYEAKIGKTVSQKSTTTSYEAEEDDIRYFTATDLYDTNELASIQDEMDYLASVEETLNQESEISESKEATDNDEYILFTIKDQVTLKEIAKNVYQSEENWRSLYNYGSNTNKIDRKSAEYGMSVEEIASTPGCLNNVTLQFPTLLITPEEIDIAEHKTSRRAA